MHHRTIQINHQPDATVFQFIILTFIYSSTCFRRSPAYHQELNDCSSSFWFYLRIVVIAVLCSWSARSWTQHGYHHDTKVKPEAATAVIEFLMIGGRTPETCWAVNKRQDNKLENCCIWLVIYLNCQSTYFLIFWNSFHFHEECRIWKVIISYALASHIPVNTEYLEICARKSLNTSVAVEHKYLTLQVQNISHWTKYWSCSTGHLQSHIFLRYILMLFCHLLLRFWSRLVVRMFPTTISGTMSAESCPIHIIVPEVSDGLYNPQVPCCVLPHNAWLIQSFYIQILCKNLF